MRWPPSFAARNEKGQRMSKPPPPIDKAGIRAPSPKELGISLEELLQEIRAVEGLPPAAIVPRAEWPLHLKQTTMANIPAILQLPLQHDGCRRFLRDALRFLRPEVFRGLVTARTFRSTNLSWDHINTYMAAGKCVEIKAKEPLPVGEHSVIMHTVPEAKQRVRIVNEPALNSCVGPDSLCKVRWRSRLARRQRHRRSYYMLQVDYDAFYNSIEIDEEQRRSFIFKKDGRYFALTTLATGGRWSVGTGQAITWAVVNFETGAVIDTIIDNILCGAQKGQEAEFCRTVRLVARRSQLANLQTTPPAADILSWSDRELLGRARGPTTFMGEVYQWDDSLNERVVSNCPKTMAKLNLAIKKPAFTKRTFAGLVSLFLYAAHTVNIAPARCFHVLNGLRAVGKAALRDGWDSPAYMSPNIAANVQSLFNELKPNIPTRIEPPFRPTYDDAQYSNVIFCDASGDGWGAIARSDTGTTTFQRRWVNRLDDTGQRRDDFAFNEIDQQFCAKSSAHAEPTAILELLQFLDSRGELGARTAIATDHYPIVLAQRKTNGYGGIGKGRALNALFKFTHDLLLRGHIVIFFYIPGPLNPADEASRNFGDSLHGHINATKTDDNGLPLLTATFCPLCEEEDIPEPWMK
jgi:hypothetical protein